MTSRSDPLRLIFVLSLASTRFEQHMLSNQREDLDKSIFYLTESILFPPSSWLKYGPNILQTLFLLAFALLRRSVLSKQPEDVIYATHYLRYLRDQPHQAFGIPRHRVTTLLVDALACQVKLEAGSAMQNIGEMADLCRELLTLDTPDVDTTRSITVLSRTALSKINALDPDQPLDQIIECLRAARKHEPDLGVACYALAASLCCRYCMTFANDVYDEAASLLDEMITSSPPGDNQDEAQELVFMLAMIRSFVYQTPEHLEEATYRTRAHLGISSFNESFDDPTAEFSLEYNAEQRGRYFGSVEGLKASSSRSVPTELLEECENDFPEFVRMYKNMGLLGGLLSGVRDDDIEEALEKGRTILASFDPSNGFTLDLCEIFGNTLFVAFERTRKIDYLNESISTWRRVLEPFPPAPSPRSVTLTRLSIALLIRSMEPPGHREDLYEGLEILSRCASDGYASLPDRFKSACCWAFVARLSRHPSVSAAYESAVSLMQDTLLFAPTLQLQHATLVTSDVSPRMPLDYASYQIDLHRLEEAIETLERGRALLWSEMRHLRASIDRLLQDNPQLGHKFAAVSRDLEDLTKSIPPSHKLSADDATPGDFRAVDPFGRLLLKQRALLKERDDLISQIHTLPGFDSFLASPSFDTLRSAASCGPVIIINHSEWRSDILILCYNTAPSLISTPDDFFSRASALKDVLLDARNKHGPDSTQYNQTLADVLTELYDLVGKPVIDRLRQLKVPEQSRVWWCPTSVFCSLPLHAMGPIPSGDGSGGERYFLDLYIPSYTPTLSALVPESDHREPGSPTSGVLPSLLLVAHFDVPSPDVPLSEVCEDVKVVQALNTRLPVKSLISEGATATSALDGLQDHPFVHFVCHGTLEAQKPFDAGFELHGHERLTLLRIVRSQLPAAEFAFLSACHTAGLTDGSSADEGLHLAAAVQYCGFRSVVGTMWAMANTDGADLAKHFYKTMFPKREQGEYVPYYKRSAGALREAVKKLRKKRGITLERWVNFVHYGA